MKTQNEMVLEHLRTHESINVAIAYYDYGIAALHSRISDLRKQGHVIEKIGKTIKNREGKKIRVFDYKLIYESTN